MSEQTALTAEFQSHPVTAYVNSLTSNHSKRAMLSALKSVMALAMGEDPRQVDPMIVYTYAWGDFTTANLKAIRAALLAKYSKRMAAKCYSAVRGVLGACFDQELIDAERWMRFKRVKGISVQSDHQAGRLITDGEIRALARVCGEDKAAAGARDDAIIGIGYTQGPRINEFANMLLSDYDPLTGNIVIRFGKGGKTRTIRVANSVKDSLDEWIGIRGSESGPLFMEVDKGGNVIGASYKYKRKGKKVTARPGLSTPAIDRILKERAQSAGVKPFTCHDLRRSFITNAWAIGLPGPYIQKLAGHSSIATTASYDRSDLEEALRSGEKLHYPSMRNQ